MSSLIVFVEDLIRDERVRVRLDAETPVVVITDGLVEQFGLPRRDFDLSQIEYRLVRAVDGALLANPVSALASERGWQVHGLTVERGRLDEVFREVTGAGEQHRG